MIWFETILYSTFPSLVKTNKQSNKKNLDEQIYKNKNENINVIVGIELFTKFLFNHITDELGLNKDRYKSLADEMDSTFAELAGY